MSYLFDVVNGEVRIDAFLREEAAEERAAQIEGAEVVKREFEGPLVGLSQRIEVANGYDDDGNPKTKVIKRKVYDVKRRGKTLTGEVNVAEDRLAVKQTKADEPWVVTGRVEVKDEEPAG